MIHRYSDGQVVRLADKVHSELGLGRVTAVLDSHQFSNDMVQAEWAYLETGIVVTYDDVGIVHYPGDVSELRLVQRGKEIG